MHGRYFDGRQLECFFWDGVTDFKRNKSTWEEDEEEDEDEEEKEAKRLKNFEQWILTQHTEEKKVDAKEEEEEEMVMEKSA